MNDLKPAAKELMKALTQLVSLLNTLLEDEMRKSEDAPTEEAPKARKKKAPAKKTAPKVEEPEDEEDDMGFDMGDDEDADTPEASIDDVRGAFKDFVKKVGDAKKGRAAAGKILKKFKVTSVDQLEASDYGKVLSTIEVEAEKL